MKKTFMILAAVCVSFIAAYAQKMVVVVADFQITDEVTEAQANSLRSFVIQGLAESNRFRLIDALTEFDAQQVATLRNDLGQVKSLGAQYVITGSVNRVGTTQYQDSDGSVSHRGNIVYSLSAMNVEDGTLVGTKTYTHSGLLSAGSGATHELAINNTYPHCKKDMKSFVQEFFPLQGKVVELAEAKGDKVKTLYVSLGSDAGMKEGQKFVVLAVKTVAGQQMTTEIGKLTLEEVNAPALSLCKVTGGSKEIMQASKDGVEMLVKTVAGFTIPEILQ